MGREVRDRKVKENHPLKGTGSGLGCVGVTGLGKCLGRHRSQKL